MMMEFIYAIKHTYRIYLVTCLTFLYLYREDIHLLYSLLELILRRRCNWIHIIISAIIFLIGEGTKNLFNERFIHLIHCLHLSSSSLDKIIDQELLDQ